MDNSKNKLIVILGPTSSGKSDLAIQITLQLSSGQAQKQFGINGAEIISADSRQVYKELNIGSGKITKKEMKSVPHHLLDVASAKKTFTVSQYQKLAQKTIEKILSKGKIPIICGGTGFYIDSLIYNYKLPKVPPQIKLRKQLEKETEQELFKQLKKLDSRRAKSIDKYNKRRLIRALEIVLTTKKPVPHRKSATAFETLMIGIEKSPDELKKLIRKRLEKRLKPRTGINSMRGKQGLIEEVERLHGQGLSWKRLDDLGLEYRYVSRYLRGLITKKEMVDSILKQSWQYAKRQMTWFKKYKNARWIKNQKQAEKLVEKFLEKKKGNP